MTLVIAGFNSENKEEGVYFASDSHITQQNQILVKGFKKVIEVPIRVKQFHIYDNWFAGYRGNRFESACAIAFAGSSLVAQHLINSIKNHLSELYPTLHQGSYQIAMLCENTKLLNGHHQFDSTDFLDSDIDPLLDARLISNVVAHSIDAVLKRARKHGSMKNLFVAYQAEFILGVQCPQTKEHFLFQYDIVPDEELDAKVEFHEIEQNDIAIIGMKGFKEDALSVLGTSTEEDPPSSKIFSFLNDKIDVENSQGNNGIGKPCSLYKLVANSLTRDEYEE